MEFRCYNMLDWAVAVWNFLLPAASSINAGDSDLRKLRISVTLTYVFVCYLVFCMYLVTLTG